ncbi:hypothetical protein [Halalkalicoccus salilacus]|uniref:hypothetical protein n=1 Tax=Halalkalicoccus salilacus TaxID=3117459 RepID=UPI00300EBCB1
MEEMNGFTVAFRLGVAVFVIVTPTLMFLGLVRLLKIMGDEELIYRLLTEEELRQVERSHSLSSFVERATGSASKTIRCRACGTINVTGMETCHECGSSLG